MHGFTASEVVVCTVVVVAYYVPDEKCVFVVDKIRFVG